MFLASFPVDGSFSIQQIFWIWTYHAHGNHYWINSGKIQICICKKKDFQRSPNLYQRKKKTWTIKKNQKKKTKTQKMRKSKKNKNHKIQKIKKKWGISTRTKNRKIRGHHTENEEVPGFHQSLPDFVPFSGMVYHLPVVQTQTQAPTDTDTHHTDTKQTSRQTHTPKKKLYSRRWSWPSFHRGGSNDPSLRRHARHCGTKPATSVLVLPQDVFGVVWPSLKSRFWK